jgi:hypothetical protein
MNISTPLYHLGIRGGRGVRRPLVEPTPVRRESIHFEELTVPKHVLHDESRLCVVLELISGDVDDRSTQFQPRVGVLASVAKYVVRSAMAVLVKILSQQKRRVAASPVGEVLQSDRKVTRLTLFNRAPKRPGEPLYLLTLIVCEVSGSVFMHHGYVEQSSGFQSEQPAEGA